MWEKRIQKSIRYENETKVKSDTIFYLCAVHVVIESNGHGFGRGQMTAADLNTYLLKHTRQFTLQFTSLFSHSI